MPIHKPTYDELLTTLADRRRRVAIQYLHDNGSTSIHELAAVLDDWKDGTLSTGGVEVLVNTLRHRHIPQLERVHLVEYDRDTDTIVPTIDADGPTLELLEVINRGDDR